MAALKATSLEEMRKKTTDEILGSPSADRYDSAAPIRDGYVLTGSMEDFLAADRKTMFRC